LQVSSYFTQITGVDALHRRLRDVESEVREAAIATIMSVAVKNRDAVNEQLLLAVRDRANDKKVRHFSRIYHFQPSVRAACLSHLSMLYHSTMAAEPTVSEVRRRLQCTRSTR